MAVAAQIIGGSVISGLIGASATDKAMKMQREGLQAGLAQRQKFFDIAQGNLAPYREIGTEAVAKLNSVFIEGDMDEFFESPDFKFVQEQGQRGLDAKQGQAGARYGGRALREASEFNTGVASKSFGDFFNRLQNIASMGQNAAAGTASAAVNTGSGNAASLEQSGVNQGNIAIQQGQSLNNAIQGGISNIVAENRYNDLKSMLQPTTASPTVASIGSQAVGRIGE